MYRNTIIVIGVIALLVGLQLYFQRDAQSDLHVKLATLDVEYAACNLQSKQYNYERLGSIKGGAVSELQYYDAKFAFQLAEVELRRSEILQKLTERTGRYYGLGGRTAVP